ncbi:MAG TPA: VanW family protein [Gaiella sp.]|nr:VanW family protein [Gaiella sp.]
MVRRTAFVVAAVAVLAILTAILLAGSPTRLAAGTTVAGIDVGGLEPSAATALLERRARRVEGVPVAFVAGGRVFRYTPRQLGVRWDWSGAVAEAARATEGVAPLRGFRRLRSRMFGVDIEAATSAFPSAVRVAVARMAKAVDRPAVNAGVLRRGLSFQVTPAKAGVRLDRAAASAALVTSLASFERGAAVALPVVRDTPETTAGELAGAVASLRVAVSAPVTLRAAGERIVLPRERIAQIVGLHAAGETRPALAGDEADRWLAGLARRVNRPPRNATFAVSAGSIDVVPAQRGRALDMAAARRSISRAIFSTRDRRATLAVRTTPPDRSTADAKAMGITGVVGSYTTTYGGTEGRLHNVRLVAELIDGALVAPGARFSFNETTGERNASRGFAEAPVIINGELQNGIGGGVCQVSTTVFNAAFEAGLSIESRTNHALYISHYPLGRDATVNYPDIDLVFTNDTDRWLLLRTFVGPGSLTVNLYGTPQNRRVETETAPLRVEGKVPWERIDDPTMFRGEKVVERFGAPPRSTSVTRRVYAADGTLMYDTTWSSHYVGEPTVVRLGTKARPKPEPTPKAGVPGTDEPGAKPSPEPATPRTSTTSAQR